MLTKIKYLSCVATVLMFFTACEPQEEPLNYNSVSDFYGPWELTDVQSTATSTSSKGFAEYVNFLNNGTLLYLKVYDSNYYPDGMIDLLEYNWSLTLNDLQWDVMTYHVDYCSGNEIFLSKRFKLRRIPDTLWDYYANPQHFKDYQSVNEEGIVLNYKNISDFYGKWQLASDSFGSSYNNETTQYVNILSDNKLISMDVDNESGQTEEKEFDWHIVDNTFYWDILNYDIDYCKEDEISLSRSATHIILTRVAE